MRSLVLSLGLILTASGAVQASPAPQPVQAPARNHADCYCRAEGRSVPVGEKICLRTAEGPRLAQCEMELNVTSWTITRAPCPES